LHGLINVHVHTLCKGSWAHFIALVWWLQYSRHYTAWLMHVSAALCTHRVNTPYIHDWTLKKKNAVKIRFFMLLPYIRIEQHWRCANLTSLAGNQSEQGQLVAIPTSHPPCPLPQHLLYRTI